MTYEISGRYPPFSNRGMSGIQGVVYAILVFYSIPLNYNCLFHQVY